MTQSEEDLCNLILLPDEEKRKTIYSNYYVYEYKNSDRY